MDYRLFLISLLVVTLHAEYTHDNDQRLLQRVKRFLRKKTTTPSTTTTSSFAAIGGLITTTSSSVRDDKSGKYSDKFGSTSKYARSRNTTLPIKPACDSNNPCENGGTCRTLPSGRHYCYCTEQYYGRNCEKKFKYTGYETKTQLEKDVCSNSPCRNLGVCVPTGKNYYCRCKTPYYGTNCEKRLSKRETFE